MGIQQGFQQARAILKAATHPATLGKATHQFLNALEQKLPEDASDEQFGQALATTLTDKRYRGLASGLRALAEAAWLEKRGPDFKSFLRNEAEIAHDADARDGWNRDVRKNLGPILQTVVRRGQKELTTADTVQAFALQHGLPLLETTIRERYQPPKIEDKAKWASQVTDALKADLAAWPKWEAAIDLSKVEQLTGDLAASFDAWIALPPPEQIKLWDRVKEKAEEYKQQPLHVLLDLLKGFGQVLNSTPTEAHLLASVALSLAIAVKIGFAVTTLPMALLTTAALLAGWFVADLQGAGFHHNADNYPSGRIGREFIDHHYNPTAVSQWPLRRNTGGLVKPTTPALAMAAYFLPGGPLAAFLLTMMNGLIYTQHIHGFSHAAEKDLPLPIRILQKAGLLLPPDEHRKHHSKPLGKECYGVLNGWSNWPCDKLEFWRMVEAVRRHYTGQEPTWIKEAEVRKIAMERKKNGARGLANS